ncbi:MAG: ABC transporter permease, partial [Betaproteobacteria bacterium]
AQTAFADGLKADTTYAVIFFAGVGVLYLAPVLIGMFWGAPLIARELEAGTLRIAWTQSVSRADWLKVKLLVVGLAGVLTTGALSLAVTWWSAPIDDAMALPGQPPLGGFPNRFHPLIFGARDLVPMGYAAFAFSAGVTTGLLLRRTLVALAVTLAVVVAVQVLVPVAVRPEFRTPEQAMTAVTLIPDGAFKLRLGNDTMAVSVPVNIPGAWVISTQMADAVGRPVSPRTPPACQDPAAPPVACDNAINQLHLTELVRYQPANRFWAFQLYETGGYLVLSLILVAFCLGRVRRLRPY